MNNLVNTFTLPDNRELLMSYGLLTDITRIVRDPELVGAFPLSPELRDQVLNVVLAKRNKTGRVEEEVTVYDIDLTPDTVDELIVWISEHVLDFFIRRAETVKRFADKHKDVEARVQQLSQS